MACVERQVFVGFGHIGFAHADPEGIERMIFRFADEFVIDAEGGGAVEVAEDDVLAAHVAGKLDETLGRRS